MAAALFLAGATFAIASTAARALDAQGDDRFSRLLFGANTQQQWLRVSDQLINGKKPLPEPQLSQARAEAVRAPLSGFPYFLAGASRNLNGDNAGGVKLVDIAIRRDPRFLPPRYWKIADAAVHDRVVDATDATLRVLALHPDEQGRMVPVLVQLSRSPASWPLIRRAIAGDAPWREIYFNKLVESGFEPSIVFNAIDVAREVSGAPPAGREQVILLTNMVQKGDFERAYTAWVGWLPPSALAKIAYLYDGGFSGAPGSAPFNWTLSSEGEGAGAIDKGQGLRFDYQPSQNLEIASQLMLLPPGGQYRMTSIALLDQAMTQDAEVPVSWQVTCLPKRNVIASLRLPDSTTPKGVAITFDVPADCPAQQLSLAGTAMEFPIRMGGYVRSIAIDKAKK